jgi:hypothetical protein
VSPREKIGVDRACASAGRAYEAARANAIPFGHESSESSAFFSVMRPQAHAKHTTADDSGRIRSDFVNDSVL